MCSYNFGTIIGFDCNLLQIRIHCYMAYETALNTLTWCALSWSFFKYWCKILSGPNSIFSTVNAVCPVSGVLTEGASNSSSCSVELNNAWSSASTHPVSPWRVVYWVHESFTFTRILTSSGVTLASKYSLVKWTFPAFIWPDRKLLRPKELLFDSVAGEMNLFHYAILQVVFVMFSNHNPVFTFLGPFLACYRCFQLHLPSVGAPNSRWWRAHISRPTVINFLHLISSFLFKNKYIIVYTILFAATLDLCSFLRMGDTTFHSHREKRGKLREFLLLLLICIVIGSA